MAAPLGNKNAIQHGRLMNGSLWLDDEPTIMPGAWSETETERIYQFVEYWRQLPRSSGAGEGT